MQRAEPDDTPWYASHHPDRLIPPPACKRSAAQYSRNKAALIAYASSWMKCHHPDVFCCALLNAQPMEFYAPAQIVRDAQTHGVEVRPVSVNHSRWGCTLEPTDGRFLAVRLGMHMVKGLANAHGAEIVTARGEHAYGSVDELWRRARVPPAALERLAEADAFHALCLERREALWAICG